MLKELLEGKYVRHPLHPMLVHFPIGLFFLSLLLDIASFVFGDASGLVRTAFYSMLVAIIAALLATVPGFVDYTDIRRDRPGRRTATTHMVLNLIVVAVYGVNLGLRAGALDTPRTPMAPFIISCIAFSVLLVSGYLGGRLIYDEGIGVGRHRRQNPAPETTVQVSAEAPGAESSQDALRVPVREAKTLTDRQNLRLKIEDTALVLFKIEGEYFAFQDACTHRFAPLSEGAFQGYEVECPWHHSCFDVRSGKVTHGPAKVDLKTFKVEVQDGTVWITVPRPSPEEAAASSEPDTPAEPGRDPSERHDQ